MNNPPPPFNNFGDFVSAADAMNYAASNQSHTLPDADEGPSHRSRDFHRSSRQSHRRSRSPSLSRSRSRSRPRRHQRFDNVNVQPPDYEDSLPGTPPNETQPEAHFAGKRPGHRAHHARHAPPPPPPPPGREPNVSGIPPAGPHPGPGGPHGQHGHWPHSWWGPNHHWGHPHHRGGPWAGHWSGRGRGGPRCSRGGARGFGGPGAFLNNGADIWNMIQTALPNVQPGNMADLAKTFAEQLGLNPEGAPKAGAGGARAEPDNSDVDFEPVVDMFDLPTAYVIHVELPGAKKEDCSLTWDEKAGELKVQGVVGRKVDEEQMQGMIIGERDVGVFARSLKLGPEVDPDNITAKMEEGVLVVRVGKKGAEEEFVEVKKVDIL